jgi:hypothetical protein
VITNGEVDRPVSRPLHTYRQHLASLYPNITVTTYAYRACNAQGHISCLRLLCEPGKYLPAQPKVLVQPRLRAILYNNIVLYGSAGPVCLLCAAPVAFIVFVTSEVFTAVTLKNVVFWDTKTQFVLHRRHITSPLQSSAS